VKALGFISILEREYGLDLQGLKEEALTYYDQHKDDTGVTLSMLVLEEKPRRSKLIPLMILGLIAYASWYFFTQYDRKYLAAYLPFSEASATQKKSEKEKGKVSEEVETSLKLENALPSSGSLKVQAAAENTEQIDDGQPADTQVQVTQSDISEGEAEVSESNTEQASESALQKVTIVPERKLWFGLVDRESGERKHFTIAEPFEVDVSRKRWLIATSSAPFSLNTGEKITSFNDAKAHYFKFDKNGIKPLNKEEYVALGGYAKW
jgi:hypothetical protein